MEQRQEYEKMMMESGQQTVAEYLSVTGMNPDEIMMSDGKRTAGDYLSTQPMWTWPRQTEAIYACLKRGWPLNIMTIQSTAREIDAKRNPKGW